MLKNSISSPIKVLDIHRLNRRTKIDNKIKYLPSRTVCIKFSGQLLPQYVYLYSCRYSVSPYIPKARICFQCFRVGHVSKTCKGKPRCIHCGNDKHASTKPCPRAQSTYICINCSGDHLVTSHLCPDVIKHKMALSLASAKNIPFSEAKKSINSQSYNSFSSQYADPRFDYRNFSNLPSPRSDPSPPVFESPNRFSLLQNLVNSLSSSSSPDSFASAAGKKHIINDKYNYKKKLPSRFPTQVAPTDANFSPHHTAQNPSPPQHSFALSPSIPRDHYESLA